ncbi:MAG: aldehyde ferredoxin oxidoreductase [Deltaproteobacteria bacterium]|nr:aldehyde ferredoxin oxidoreductase [Deltaproteobacteria bacterium]
MGLIRVDMTKKEIHREEVPSRYRGLGGRGLTSIMINNEVPPTCDPLGEENKLILAPGLLTGTPMANTSRLSIGAKSPLTGTIKESNVGGTVPAALGRLGITAVVLEGRAARGELWLLRIDGNGKADFIPAGELAGMRNYALAKRIFASYGDHHGILSIGPAGEMHMKASSIQSTDTDGRPCRAAGRGGLGAVMGAKGLKAIVVDQGGDRTGALIDIEGFKAAARTMATVIKAQPFSGKVLPALGTASLVAPVNSMGAFPCYNATRGVFDGWEDISGDAIARRIRERGGKTTHMGCSQCIIHCSNEYVDEKGEFVTSSLEYETIWSMGGMIGIHDPDTIARLDFLCDDIGVDTMTTGVAIAVAMDAGYRRFGDGRSALSLLEEIATGTEMGKIFGDGPVSVGNYFHHTRVPVVKGQSIAAYDPRAMQGHAVTYATCPMGADHTAGNLISAYTSGKLDPLKAEGQVEASRDAQILVALVDCVGLCLFASSALRSAEGKEALVKAVNAKLGTRMKPEEISALGRRILKAEREFNTRAGFTREDDRLPGFFYQEPLPPHNKVVMISDEDMDETLAF